MRFSAVPYTAAPRRRVLSQGRGDAMLSFVERTAVAAGVEKIFALSTTSMQWFTERGFVEVRPRSTEIDTRSIRDRYAIDRD